jgi:geranylgeranyl diphosphate synthase, type II
LAQQTGSARLLELLNGNKKELDAIALNFLPKQSQDKQISTLYEMMRDYPSRGGKGFRGSLCLLWCELWGGKRENALITATALELFQNWILIHDDIEDESDLRRGLPALHKKYGIPLSINAGDALHGKMWELLLSNQEKLGEEITFQILKEFSTMLNETTEGQQMELAWNVLQDWGITEAEYLLMVTKKSAWYTCTSPARIGTLLAAPAAFRDFRERKMVLKQISEIGTDMGIAFQIIDDILNLTASQDKYGKEILGDILEGKRTLMLIHLLSSSKDADRQKIVSIMSKPRTEKSVEDVKEVFSSMKSTGSIQYASELAQNYAKSGLAMYDSLCHSRGLDSSRSFGLTRLVLEYLVKRDY